MHNTLNTFQLPTEQLRALPPESLAIVFTGNSEIQQWKPFLAASALGSFIYDKLGWAEKEYKNV